MLFGNFVAAHLAVTDLNSLSVHCNGGLHRTVCIRFAVYIIGGKSVYRALSEDFAGLSLKCQGDRLIILLHLRPGTSVDRALDPESNRGHGSRDIRQVIVPLFGDVQSGLDRRVRHFQTVFIDLVAIVVLDINAVDLSLFDRVRDHAADKTFLVYRKIRPADCPSAVFSFSHFFRFDFRTRIVFGNSLCHFIAIAVHISLEQCEFNSLRTLAALVVLIVPDLLGCHRSPHRLVRVGIRIRDRLAFCSLCTACDAFSGHCNFYAFRLDLERRNVLPEKLCLLVLVIIENLCDHIGDLVSEHIHYRNFDRFEVFAPVIACIQFYDRLVVKIVRAFSLDPDLDRRRPVSVPVSFILPVFDRFQFPLDRRVGDRGSIELLVLGRLVFVLFGFVAAIFLCGVDLSHFVTADCTVADIDIMGRAVLVPDGHHDLHRAIAVSIAVRVIPGKSRHAPGLCFIAINYDRHISRRAFDFLHHIFPAVLIRRID